jgi:hypothetical protein
MDVRCIHFCQQYAVEPDGIISMIGIFNSYEAPSFPYRAVFWVVVHLGGEQEDRKFRHKVTLRTTGPQGDAAEVTEHVVSIRPAAEFTLQNSDGPLAAI